MDIDIESLERATLDAVAPVEVASLPSWLLPYDTTTIGRATSAVPKRHTGIDPASIAEIERLYAQRGLRPQYRVANVAGLSKVHDHLLELGYTAQKPTLTMVGDVRDWAPAAPDQWVQVTKQANATWQSVYLAAEFDPVDAANRIRALSRSKFLAYANLCNESGAIAAGSASISQGWVSLHGLRTLASARRQGCATRLISALGQMALTENITRCFLQVEADNVDAIRLYCSLGFQTAWMYHYWRKPH